MDKNRIIADLREEEGQIRTQIQNLKVELEAMEITIRRLSSNHEQSEVNVPPIQSTNEQLSLTPAAKHLILTQSPNKVWTPTGLRDGLVNMRKRGELKSKTEDLLPPSHRILDSFERQGFLRKIKKGRFQIPSP